MGRHSGRGQSQRGDQGQRDQKKRGGDSSPARTLGFWEVNGVVAVVALGLAAIGGGWTFFLWTMVPVTVVTAWGVLVALTGEK